MDTVNQIHKHQPVLQIQFLTELTVNVYLDFILRTIKYAKDALIMVIGMVNNVDLHLGLVQMDGAGIILKVVVFIKLIARKIKNGMELVVDASKAISILMDNVHNALKELSSMARNAIEETQVPNAETLIHSIMDINVVAFLTIGNYQEDVLLAHQDINGTEFVVRPLQLVLLML